MSKRILITGTELHLLQFWIYHIDNLIKSGYEVDLLCSEVGDKLKDLKAALDEISSPKLTVVELERSPISPKNFKGFLQIRDYLKHNSYDVIITNEPVMGLMTRLAANKYRKKTTVIYFAHGFHFWDGAPFKNWLLFYPVEKFAAYLTDIIVTMNSEDYKFAKEKLGADVKYTYGIGCDFSKFKFDENTRLQKRNELGLTDEFMIFTVSELTDRKNLFLALQAVDNLVKDGYDVRYYIRGKGPLEKNYKEFIASHNLERNVFLLGYGKDIVEMCNAVDVFLFTSKQEGMPVALLEAMSVEVPCVVSNIRGSNDLIADGIGGYICDIDRPDMFSDRITEIIENNNKAELIKTNKEVLEYYSREKVFSFIKKLVEECDK